MGTPNKPFHQLLREEVSRLPEIVEEALRSDIAPLLADAPCVAATGSGDSYAAAVAAAALAGERGEALDPLDAVAEAKPRGIASRGCTLLAISAGGRTKTVIELAEAVASRGGRVVCITAPGSPLAARACTELAELGYTSAPMGVGAARHAASLAIAARLLGYEPRLERLQASCRWLKADIYVGVAESLASAIYASNKQREVYARIVPWERLEQLLHAGVFGARSVALFYSASLPRKRQDDIARALREAGLRVYRVPPTRTPWDTVLAQAALIASCLAERAARDGVEEPAYMRHPGLETLTSLIYYG